MARSLKAGVSGILSGGTCYWMIIVYRNTGDNWGSGIDQVVAGTITSEGFGADTTIWTGRLFDISDICYSVNIFESALMRVADVDVTIQNVDSDITATNYQGRKVEIRLGHGAEMNLATSDVFFTGKIFCARNAGQDIVFTCRGLSQMQDKEIGEQVPDTVPEKFRNKIIPKIWGDWTDDNAYMPLVIMNDAPVLTQIVFDTQELYSNPYLRLWDKNLSLSYAVEDTAQYTVAANKASLVFKIDTTATLTKAVSALDEWFYVSNYLLLNFFQSSGTDVPAPSVLQIDDEQILLLQRSSNIIVCERGYNGTLPAPHASGSAIYQYDENVSKLLIKVTDYFYPIGLSGFYNLGSAIMLIWKAGSYGRIGEFGNLIDDNLDDYCGFHTPNQAADPSSKVYADMVFPDYGIEGDVLNQYIIAKADCEVTPATGGGTTVASIYIVKDGSTGIQGPSIVNATQIDSTDEVTDSFNNIDGADGKTDKEVNAAIRVDDIKNLKDTRYSLVYRYSSDVAANMEVKAYKVGFRIDFISSPLKNDFFGRGKGRIQPADYFNGNEDDLIDSPSVLLEDFFRNDVKDMSNVNLSEDHFDSFHTDRSDWKMAVSISGESKG